MSDVFRLISKQYSNFGTERVRAFSVREGGVGNRLPHKLIFGGLIDELREARSLAFRSGCDSSFFVLTGVVLKSIELSWDLDVGDRLGLERVIAQVRAAVLGALYFAENLLDENYQPHGSGEEGKNEQVEVLVRTLVKIRDSITPENLNLDGQTLLLVDITVRPENSEKVLDAVRQVLASLSSHPSMQGISVESSESTLL